MAECRQAVTLYFALCAVSVFACTPQSGSDAATQSSPSTLAVRFDVVGSDRPDGYVVYPELQPSALQLHPEKLTASIRSTDDKDFRERLAYDSSVSLPTNSAPLNISWAGFHLAYDRLRPGMYVLSGGAAPGYMAESDGSHNAVNVIGGGDLTIYVPQHPDQMPKPATGAQFIFLMSFGSYGRPPPSIVDDRGSTLPFDQVAARPLTFVGVGSKSSSPAGVQFERAGDHFRILFPGISDPSQVPGLYRLVEDRSTRRMTAKYRDHRVWTYGPEVDWCVTIINDGCDITKPDADLFVVGVYRARGYAEDMAIRRGGGGYYKQPSSFRALDPLIVALRDRNARDGNMRSIPLPPQGPNAYATFSDDWDLERSYSLISMERSHPEWPVSVRDAIVKGQQRLGMSRDMIAWMLGYPSTYGTIAQMKKLDTWIYDGPPMTDMNFNYTFFFQNDRVVKCYPECKSRL
jgi:hypothetical protein